MEALFRDRRLKRSDRIHLEKTWTVGLRATSLPPVSLQQEIDLSMNSVGSACLAQLTRHLGAAAASAPKQTARVMATWAAFERGARPKGGGSEGRVAASWKAEVKGTCGKEFLPGVPGVVGWCLVLSSGVAAAPLSFRSFGTGAPRSSRDSWLK